MKPEVWGPHAWIFLHSITLEYPDQPTIDEKKNMATFINSLGLILPCQKCRINFNYHLQQYPLNDTVLQNKTNLVKWMIDIHNCVNEMTNKRKLSYENGLQEILKLYNENNNKLIITIAIIFIIVIIFLLILNIFYLRT